MGQARPDSTVRKKIKLCIDQGHVRDWIIPTRIIKIIFSEKKERYNNYIFDILFKLIYQLYHINFLQLFYSIHVGWSSLYHKIFLPITEFSDCGTCSRTDSWGLPCHVSASSGASLVLRPGLCPRKGAGSVRWKS